MLTVATIIRFTTFDGKVIDVPEYVLSLYRCYWDHRNFNFQMGIVPQLKWLRLNLGLGLKDAKDLHEALKGRNWE